MNFIHHKQQCSRSSLQRQHQNHAAQVVAEHPHNRPETAVPAQEEGGEARDGVQTDAELSQLGFDDRRRWPVAHAFVDTEGGSVHITPCLRIDRTEAIDSTLVVTGHEEEAQIVGLKFSTSRRGNDGIYQRAPDFTPHHILLHPLQRVEQQRIALAVLGRPNAQSTKTRHGQS